MIVVCLIVFPVSEVVFSFKDAEAVCGGSQPGMCGKMAKVRSLT